MRDALMLEGAFSFSSKKICKLGSLFIVIFFLSGYHNALSQTHEKDRPLAEMNGEIITVKEFMERIGQLPPFLRETLETEEGKRRALEHVIVWRLIFQDALLKGVDKKPEVEARITAAREQIIIWEYLKQQASEKAAIPEKVLQEYYVKNREEFKLSEAIKVSQILVGSEKEAQEILEELKKGADFSKLARERSLDPSRRNGGQMGWLERRVMDLDFAEAAFALKKGGMSGVVHTQFGYHIIRVDDKRPPEYAEYDKVKEQIREKMTRKQAQERVEQIKKDLRVKAKITIHEEVLKAMKVKGDAETSKALTVP